MPPVKSKSFVVKRDKKPLKKKSTALTVTKKQTDLKEVKKKKKKVGEQAAVAKTMLSVFGKKAPKILDLIDQKDTDGALTLIQKQILKSLVSTLPIAEQKMLESDTTRGIYGYNALISQIREVLVDIQSAQDKQFIAQNINVGILQPFFISMAQAMIDSNYRLKKSIVDYIKPDRVRDVNEAIDANAKSIAEHMNMTYGAISAKIEQQFEV